MNIVENLPLFSIGHQLDMSEEAFGELRESSACIGNGKSLRARMEEDGYLFIRGFFKREDVLAARHMIVERLAKLGFLQPGSNPMDAHIKPGAELGFRGDLAPDNTALHQLLYTGSLIDFYQQFFGEVVRHFDYTWLRAVGPGKGTHPHCDVVYMGRGTREKLLTAWVPLGDAPLHVGGLMILENSHHQYERLQNYLKRDVDTYCSNRVAAPPENHSWNGALSKNPASLREKLGGRWLTTDFEIGDLLTFTMHTVHGSIDNQSDRVRLSSDSRYQPASLPADERWIGENPIAHGLAGKRGRIC